MSDEGTATEEELRGRIHDLSERVILWDGGDPESVGFILENLGYLRDAWPEGEGQDLARDTCNRIAHSVLLLAHQLNEESEEIQTVLSAALALLRALAGGGDYTKALEELHAVAKSVAEESDDERAVKAATDLSQGERALEPVTRDKALFAGDKGFLTDFVSEATEHLENIDVLLLTLEKNSSDAETLNGLFRSCHTIKGVADFLALVDISNLTHCVESLLDELREGTLVCRAEMLDLLFEATDLLKRLVRSVAVSVAEEKEVARDPRVHGIVSRLHAACRTEQVRARGRTEPEPSRTVSARDGQTECRETGVKQDQTSDEPVREKAEKKRMFDLPSMVKVDFARLDMLLDTIGELVVAVSVAHQATAHEMSAAESAARTQVEKLTHAVQELGTSLRMVPLRATFRKMVRQSRDLGKRCGKSLEFTYHGESTEVDRTIVQRIQDPLIHILRNAIDHGLEDRQERLERGKPEVARVGVRAYYKGGDIFVEVADDGRGFDPDLILEKALATGRLQGGEELTRNQILNLVFEPGFSTKDTATNISGRGVGMDVVKQTVENLHGSVEIESTVGKGTVITMRLPLTVAMMEGMVIRVGTHRYVVPTLSMVRVLQPQPGELKTVSGREEFLVAQDKLIPLVRLGRVFEIEDVETEITRGVVVLVEGRGRTVGLFVEELLGQQQIVVKSLGRALRHVSGIAGGTVLPDGRVGLILDIPGVLELAQNMTKNRFRAVS